MFNDIRQSVAEFYVIIGHILDDGVIGVFVFIEIDLYGSGGIGIVPLEAGIVHSQSDDLFSGFFAKVICAEPTDDDTAMAE